MTPATYDSIGTGYSAVRRADPRVASQIQRALGDATSVVNVGAGSGSYEPDDVMTIAVEPSRVMIRQRPSSSAPVVQARAEHLPFGDKVFDVAMALLTVHHWAEPELGLAELQRVGRRQVVLTWDPEVFEREFWFARDYLVSGRPAAEHGTAPRISAFLGPDTEVQNVLVPADCTDGFYAAYWARPEAILDAGVRDGISAFALEDPHVVAAAVDRLAADLASGEWDRRYGELRTLEALDLGYRLVIAG